MTHCYEIMVFQNSQMIKKKIFPSFPKTINNKVFMVLKMFIVLYTPL